MGLEAGTTQRTRHLQEIARALGVSVEELAGDEKAAVRGATSAAVDHAAINFQSLPKDIPVLGQVVGGDGGDFQFNGQTIDFLRRPPGISTMKDVFGLYVMGSSMWPKFEEGEPIYVSGSRPPAIGDYVVVEMQPVEEGEAHAGFLKRLVRRTGAKIVCEQFNPAREIEYDREAVKSLFRVIPLAELVGI